MSADPPRNSSDTSAQSNYDRFTNMLQNRWVAGATLVITTLAAYSVASKVAARTNQAIPQILQFYLRGCLASIEETRFSYCRRFGAALGLGFVTFAGIHVGVSKFLRLPFSATSSISITLATLFPRMAYQFLR